MILGKIENILESELSTQLGLNYKHEPDEDWHSGSGEIKTKVIKLIKNKRKIDHHAIRNFFLECEFNFPREFVYFKDSLTGSIINKIIDEFKNSFDFLELFDKDGDKYYKGSCDIIRNNLRVLWIFHEYSEIIKEVLREYYKDEVDAYYFDDLDIEGIVKIIEQEFASYHSLYTNWCFVESYYPDFLKVNIYKINKLLIKMDVSNKEVKDSSKILSELIECVQSIKEFYGRYTLHFDVKINNFDENFKRVFYLKINEFLKSENKLLYDFETLSEEVEKFIDKYTYLKSVPIRKKELNNKLNANK